MNRFNWTYVDDSGKKNNIGIVHFPKKSGHLLIYCNTKLMVVDFNIFENKTYSFFIEEEMCEISIEKKEGRYLYGFEINKEIDTPRNRFRKKKERQIFWKSLLFLATFLFLLSGIVFYAITTESNKPRQKAILLTAENAVFTPAKLFIDEQKEEISYAYIVNSTVFSEKTTKAILAKAEAKINLPIQSGDEFMLQYAPQNPRIHQLNLDQPSALQIKRYQSKAVLLLQQNQHLMDSIKAKCMVQIAYEQKGLAALADIYHQETSPEENPIHNSDSYQRLIRAIPFKKLVDETCW